MTRRAIRPAEVVLGLVDPGDEAEVERLLAEDPLFRDEVARLRRTTAVLGELDRSAWRPVDPPPLAVGLVEPDVRPAPRRRRWGLRIALPAGGLAAAAAATVLVLGGGSADPSARTIALTPVEGGRAMVTLTLGDRQADLHGTDLPPNGAHDYYEAWLADRRGRMVAMGTFRVPADGRVDARMAVAVDPRDYVLVDVSLEPDDGNPAHSSRSVLRARL